MGRLKPVNQNVRVYDIVMPYIFCVSKQQLETEAVTTEVKCMCAQTKKNATNLGYQNTSKNKSCCGVLIWNSINVIL